MNGDPARAILNLNAKYHAAAAENARLRAEVRVLRGRLDHQARLWEECKGLISIAQKVIEKHRGGT